MPQHTYDLKGRRFGRLLVLRQATAKDSKDGKPWNQAHWVCECACGTVKVIAGWPLRSERVISCGCARGRRPIPTGSFPTKEARDHPNEDRDWMTPMNHRLAPLY